MCVKVGTLLVTLMKCCGCWWANNLQISFSEKSACCLQLTNSPSVPPDLSSAIFVNTSIRFNSDWTYQINKTQWVKTIYHTIFNNIYLQFYGTNWLVLLFSARSRWASVSATEWVPLISMRLFTLCGDKYQKNPSLMLTQTLSVNGPLTWWKLTSDLFRESGSSCWSLLARRSKAFRRIDIRSCVTREPTTSSKLSVGNK